MLFYEGSKNTGFSAKYLESIASNISPLFFFLFNYGNNHWMGCLYNTIDQIANYINSLEGGRSSRINEAYEWFVKGWAGATKSHPNLAAKKPIRKKYIIVPDQKDEWSCGMRVMDWIFKFLYFPNNILTITPDSIPDNDLRDQWVGILERMTDLKKGTLPTRANNFDYDQHKRKRFLENKIRINAKHASKGNKSKLPQSATQPLPVIFTPGPKKLPFSGRKRAVTVTQSM
jgi:hypothetical protein